MINYNRFLQTTLLICFLTGFLFHAGLANNLLHRADSLYTHQQYLEALSHYHKVLQNDHFLSQDFNITFKIGICYLRNKAYQEAKDVFLRLKENTPPIPEYVDYYLFLSCMGTDNPAGITNRANQYLRDYPRHFLADSVLFRLAEFKYGQGQYQQAYRDYSRLTGLKRMGRLKPYLLGKMAYCNLKLKQVDAAYEGMYQVMKKYPSDSTALKIADFFLSTPVPSSKFEFAIADVYLKQVQYNKLTARLETFIKNEPDPVAKEKARYYIIRIYYDKGQFSTALYGFNNLLPGLRDKSLESRLRLYIARCYLRVDKKRESVEAYMDYAKRYPRRRMAVECVWKANWIYEELNDIPAAIEVNQYLLSHWPRSAYRNEAQFRVGLLELRLGNFSKAEQSFRNIRNTNKKSDFHYTRSTYWLAKTYEMSGRSDVARELYIDLGSELFESYYTLKSYIRYKAAIDSLLYLEEKLYTQYNPLRLHTNLMASLMERFENLFLIRELLGDDFAMSELELKKYYPETLKGWMAMAEVYKRLGAYNEAFRIYDYIDKKYYSDLENLEKPFLLKESYPLYYNSIIGEYAEERKLDKHLVLALIRAESSFNRLAHSWADAYGLMQIIPGTARALAAKLAIPFRDPGLLFDPNYNIKLGTLYLQDLLNQFDGNYEYAIAAYNAGPHRVSRWKKFNNSSDLDFFVENIEYTETRNYTRRVMKNFWIYKMLDSWP